MPVGKKARVLTPEEEKEIREELKEMMLSGAYNTTSRYTPNSNEYPDGLMPFVDRHIRYLYANPNLDPRMYLANLRLKTRIR